MAAIQNKDRYLPLDSSLPRKILLENLRMNALLAHQQSVGRGDELVDLLRRTVAQVEKTHNRIQNMSTILFIAGLIMLGVGTYQIAFGGQGNELWSALLGGTGGVVTLAATFWTAPLDKISDSISDLVKLQAAFLGYIRVIGELDSAFQMQYLDILSGSKKISLDQVVMDTTGQVKEIMETTMSLIDKYVISENQEIAEIKKEMNAIQEKLKTITQASQK
jgi:hypothetical protein